MINDILFCLLGKTGGLFLETEAGFIINEKYNFINDSERELLKKIADIGFKYNILSNFIENYKKIFNRKLTSLHILLVGSGSNTSNMYKNAENISLNLYNQINNLKKDSNNLSQKNFSGDKFLGNSNNSNKNINNDNVMDIYELQNPQNIANSNNIKFALSNFQDKNNNNYLSPNKENEINAFNDPTQQSSMSDFMMPICLTLKNFLFEYETQICDIEAIFNHNLSLNGHYIISKLDPYSYKFDKIFDFLQIIINENYKGGELLNLIFNFCTNGDSEIKNIFIQIFINCNKILLNYITAWIINGSLASNEFFILSTNNIINQKKPFSNNADMNNNTTLINKNPESYFFKEFENSKLELENWNTNFYVDYSNIPNYFPPSLAEDILFIGKAIKVLNSKHNNISENRISHKDISVFYTSLQKLNEVIFNKDENGINIINIEILTKILNLIKAATGKYLWRLIIKQNDFFEYLNAIKNIFLTFSGEFYYIFINKIKILLNMPFDKRIEQEINEIHFKNSLKEVFNIDVEPKKNALYGSFKIKLISHGFNYDFSEKEYAKELINKKEIFLSNFSYYDLNKSLRFANTIYQSSPGAIWNMSAIDIDEEFNFNMNFSLKNFTKVFSNIDNNVIMSGLNSGIKNMNNMNKIGSNFNYTDSNSNFASKNKNENEILKNSLMKSIKKLPHYQNDNNESDVNAFAYPNSDMRFSKKKSTVQSFSVSFILHNAKNFQNKNIPSTVENLVNYFEFEFIVKYDNLTNKPSEMGFNLKFVNKTKKNCFDKNENSEKLNIRHNYVEGEYILQSKKFIFSNTINVPANNTSGNSSSNKNIYLPADFLLNDFLSSININFKNNFCIISNESGSLDFKFHFPINDYFAKDKRKVYLGILFKSQNIDIALDLKGWNFNVLSGEIYNENSNLILIDFTPSWPHNFIFNDNILKMYNSIFNLLFPLKTNLILLNNIWIEKKNIAKKENYIFINIDAVHSEIVCFLQNLIYFFIFDIIELKFKNFISKCENCFDFEQIIKHHEEFLGEVISNSFIKSKKIMNILFDILFITRNFCNFIEMTLTEINLLFLKNEEDNQTVEIEDILERVKGDLERIKKEFHAKVNSLIDIFSKIKNSKYYSLISQLLVKLSSIYNSNSSNIYNKFG